MGQSHCKALSNPNSGVWTPMIFCTRARITTLITPSRIPVLKVAA
jgi:hypothetical protein